MTRTSKKVGDVRKTGDTVIVSTALEVYEDGAFVLRERIANAKLPDGTEAHISYSATSPHVWFEFEDEWYCLSLRDVLEQLLSHRDKKVELNEAVAS